MPVWSPRGDAIFYVNADREMVEAQIATEPAFAVTDRTVLFTVDDDVLPPRTSSTASTT